MEQSGPDQDREALERQRESRVEELAEIKSEAKARGKGCLGSLIGTMIGGIIGAAIFTAMFSPWAYYIGGRWTIFSDWEGYGKLHSSTGADYGVYLKFAQYSPRGRHTDEVRGTAALCTPQGVTYQYQLEGNIKSVWLYTEGKQASFSLYTPKGDNSKRGFDLSGVWQNGALVLIDRGSLGKPFHADGTLDAKGRYNPRPIQSEHAEVTVSYGNRFDFDEMCTNEIGKGK